MPDEELNSLAEVLRALHKRFVPNKVVTLALGEARVHPLLRERFANLPLPAAEPTLQVCQDFACQPLAQGLPAIHAKLAAL